MRHTKWIVGLNLLFGIACALGQGAAPAPVPSPAPSPEAVEQSTGAAPAVGAAPTRSASSGTTYYVAPDGDDANPGTREAPWQHPGVAVRRLQPGDTLVLLPGTYILSDYERDILRPPSGTPEGWITIRGLPDAPYPVLAGQDNLLTAFELAGRQYLRLEHLEITHNPQAQDLRFREGITIVGAPAAHLVFRDLYIHHIDEFGIDIQDVEDLTLSDSRITYTGFGALGGPTGEHGGWRQVTIRNTELSFSGHYYQGGDGSTRPYDRPDGFGIEPSAGPILIEGVIAAHNYGDGLDSKAAHTTIRNTIVANNTCDGVKLWGADSRLENVLIYGRGDGDATPTPWAAIVVDTETPNATFTFLHVTVDDALGQNYLLYVQYDHPEIPVQLVWRNLILSSRWPDAPIYLAPGVHLDAQGVLFHFPQTDPLLHHGDQTFTCATLGALGSGLQCGDPRFVQPAWGAEGDYHLQAGSPALDAGVPTEVTTDLEGQPRDAHPDLGAYERTP